MIYLYLTWCCLALALITGLVWSYCTSLPPATVTPPDPPAQSVEGRIRHMLLEGFSVWHISEELAVPANEVHEVLERIMKESKQGET